MRGQKGSYFIRIIVGAYLIYLGYKLIKDMATKPEEAENPVLFTLAGVGFIVIAAVLIILSVRGISRVQKEEALAAEEEARAEAEEKQKALEEARKAAEEAADGEGAAEDGAAAPAPVEEPAGPMSIADRIRLLSDEPEEVGEDEAADAEETEE